MSIQVSKSEFKAKALEYFRRIEAEGVSVVVTDHGQPKLEVRPYRASRQPPLDVLRGTVLRYEQPLVPVGDEDWDALR